MVTVLDHDPGQEVDVRWPGGPGLESDVIGTALTSESGEFALTFEARDFQDTDEQRPDLLVAVFAPLTSTQPGRTPPPLQQRLLHYSRYPWPLAGFQEGLVILLPEASLAGRGLLPATSDPEPVLPVSQPVVESRSVVDRAVDAWRANKTRLGQAREISDETTRRDLQDAVSVLTRAAGFSHGITGVRGSALSNPLMVPDTSSRPDRQVRVADAVRTAVTTGISLLPMPPNVMIPNTPDILDLLPGAELPTTPITVTISEVCGLLHAAAGGHDLIRVRELRDEINRLRGEVEQHEEEEPEDEKDEEKDEPEPPEPAETAAGRIQQLVERQVADLPMGADPEDWERLPRNPLARIKAELADAEFEPGPADTTAYHDVHVLQLAYPEVWGELFDKWVKVAAKLLYWEVDRLGYGSESTDAILEGEVEDLEQLVQDISQKIEAIQRAETEAIPEEVLAIFPGLGGRWHLLTPAERVRIGDDLTSTFSWTRDGRTSTANVEHLVRGTGWSGDADKLRAWMDANYSKGTSPTYRAATIVLGIDAMIRDIDFDARARASFSDRARDSDPSSESLIDRAKESPFPRLARLLLEMGQALAERYRFECYEPDTVNFGIVITYRQKWEPGKYQVGDMVATVPMAPGETRKVEVKESVKTSRATTELERSQFSRAGERSITMRASSEIVRRAEAATNFNMSIEGNFQFGIGDISVKNQFGGNQKTFSQDTKKDFREAVIKASHEYRNERSLEVKSQAEEVLDATTTATLSNTNNEVTVTYMLYELERQYRLSEQIHALQPVILVAQEVPNPADITESWLLRHEWILRRVLLDDSFHSALDELRNSFAADEASIALAKANWDLHVEVVAELEGQLKDLRDSRASLQQRYIRARELELRAKAVEDAGGFLFDIGRALAPVDPLSMASGELEARTKAARELLDMTTEQLAEAQEKAAAAEQEKDAAYREYRDAIKARTQRRTQIDQLRIHVKDNILYYMQAIWSHEPPDQRYFRLHNIEAPIPDSTMARCTVRPAEDSEEGVSLPGVPFPRVVIEGCRPSGPDITTRRLHEVADLDRPLGFKGNYMMFPLKECTTITDYMMMEYVDGYFGIRDPDSFSEFTTEDLMEYRELLEDAEQETLDAILVNRLQSPRRDTDIVVVPTGQLYMEALVGSHTLLEPFKLAHRGYDAANAREQLRGTGLENLRFASRLVAETPLLDDPQVDRYVVVDDSVGGEIDDGT